MLYLIMLSKFVVEARKESQIEPDVFNFTNRKKLFSNNLIFVLYYAMSLSFYLIQEVICNVFFWIKLRNQKKQYVIFELNNFLLHSAGTLLVNF